MRHQMVAVAVLLSFVGRSAWGSALYTVTDLGMLPGKRHPASMPAGR